MFHLATNLNLPPEIAGRRTAIFGISGSGKSNTATVMIEGLLHAGEQVVLIDPKGEGWGLLSLANGRPSYLDIIIFGEPNGHIEALDETHGPRLADFVFESGRSVVLSLLGFESDQSERRFVSTFLRHLYRRKAKAPNKSRTLVVFDEAHLFVPESSGSGHKGNTAEMAGAVQRIARQGRTFGLGSLFIDQRPQDVSKRVISQVDTVICHQLTHKTDRSALSEWAQGYDVDGRGKVFLDSLASLQPGEAWIWSPAWLKVFERIRVHLRKTFDSGAAPSGATAKVQRADIDLDQLRSQLTEIVEKAKAEDPKELRKRIEELEAQLHLTGNASRIDTDQVKHWEQQIDTLKQGIDSRNYRIQILEGHIKHAAEEIRKTIDETLHCNGHVPEAVPEDSGTSAMFDGFRRLGATRAKEWSERAASAVSTATSSPRTKSKSSLPKGEERILTALIQYPKGLARTQISVLTGYTKSSRNTYLLNLQHRGYVAPAEFPDVFVATKSGRDALPSAEPLPTGKALQQYWLERLPTGEANILSVLLKSYPHPLKSERIDELTSYTKSSRNTYLLNLRAKELVTQPTKGMMRASDTLFA